MPRYRFLSTLSLRRATHIRSTSHGRRDLSIHALLAESDAAIGKPTFEIASFYPRSPCGERHTFCRCRARPRSFYPRSPCGERSYSQHVTWPSGSFYPRSPCGERSKSAQNSGVLLRIWNKFYGDFIFMLTGKAVFYPFCPCFFHIFWCEGTGNFMIAFPSH